MSPGAKRVTIREVADAAGVSQAAVSYALRGINVSEETQERVRKVAEDLGYEANPIARALASGRTGMVGIVGPSLEDLWQQRFAAEAGRVLLARDHFALIVDAGGDPDRQRILATQLRDQQVDGLIVSPVNPSDEFWTEIAKALPVVSIGDALAGASVVGEVLFDNRTGVAHALEHLHGLGHRRIAVLRRPGSPTTDRPAEVFVGDEAERLGLDVLVLTAPYDLGQATAAAREMLSRDTIPTAAFCFSDSIAYGVYAAARELGPHDPGRSVGRRLRQPSDVGGAGAAADDVRLALGMARREGRRHGGRGDRAAAASAAAVRDRAGSARGRLDRPAPLLLGTWGRPLDGAVPS